MTKQEIEFLRSAGFTLAEIMAMQPAADPAPKPAPAPAEPEPKPVPSDTPPAPAPAPSPSPDPQAAMIDRLDKILAAVQAGNRAVASIETPPKLSPEEIAGKLY